MTEPGQQGEVAANLAAVRARIAAAAPAAGRTPAAVTLVAVAKSQPEARIEAALAAGQRVFGENYVQEAARPLAGAAAALAGRRAAPDRRAADQQGGRGRGAVRRDPDRSTGRSWRGSSPRRWRARARAPRLLVQVNTGEEPQKSGVAPGELTAFVALCRGELGLAVDGADGDPARGRGRGPAHGAAGQARARARPGRWSASA